eukprot:7377719-Prymnesium_polylepis.1
MREHAPRCYGHQTAPRRLPRSRRCLRRGRPPETRNSRGRMHRHLNARLAMVGRTTLELRRLV